MKPIKARSKRDVRMAMSYLQMNDSVSIFLDEGFDIFLIYFEVALTVACDNASKFFKVGFRKEHRLGSMFRVITVTCLPNEKGLDNSYKCYNSLIANIKELRFNEIYKAKYLVKIENENFVNKREIDITCENLKLTLHSLSFHRTRFNEQISNLNKLNSEINGEK